MLWVSQFGIVGGQAQEETPWVGLFPEDVRSPDSSDAYLIVAPATPGSAEFTAELKEAVGTMFHKSKVSLTGGLLRALQAAHEHLREWNRRSMRDHWVAAGVSCAGVRGSEVYLAQVAPASAVFSRNGQMQHLQPSLADAARAARPLRRVLAGVLALRAAARRSLAPAHPGPRRGPAAGRTRRIAGTGAGRGPSLALSPRPLHPRLRRRPARGDLGTRDCFSTEA